MTIWNLIARFAARPAVADYLIRRAMKTPFSHLPSNDDPSYMERYWLFNPYPISSSNRKRWQFPWSIRVHHIKRKDADRDLHDHPWNARTVILKGWYEERRLSDLHLADLAQETQDMIKSATALGKGKYSIYDFYVRRPGDTAKLGFEEYHQITEVSEGGVWTMFISGPWLGDWGFLVDGAKVFWRTYLEPKPAPEWQDNLTPAMLEVPTDSYMVMTKDADIAPPHNCKFCGAPSWLDPSDQTMPPDYCHEGDHGNREDYLAEWRDSFEASVRKININTGAFPPLEVKPHPASIGLPIYRAGKISTEEAFAQKVKLNAASSFHPNAASNVIEMLKDLDALEQIYRHNPQLATYVSGEFKIRGRDRDDDCMLDQPITYTFGHPDNQPGDFARLVRETLDQRRPRTAKEWGEQFNPNKEFGKMGWNGKATECAKLAKADRRGRPVQPEPRAINHPLESIAEWRKGCSCAPNEPADCNECTEGLIDAIDAWHRRNNAMHGAELIELAESDVGKDYTEEECFVGDAAYQHGFKGVDDDATVYACTLGQLVALMRTYGVKFKGDK